MVLFSPHMKRLTPLALLLAGLLAFSSCSIFGQQKDDNVGDNLFGEDGDQTTESPVKPNKGKKNTAGKTNDAGTPAITNAGPQADVSGLPKFKGKGRKLSSVAVSGMYVAFTFDDGPHPTYTPKILDILKKYNAKATFYVLGSRVNSSPSIVARMVNEGHEVGVHTWNHPSLTKVSMATVRSEMERTIGAIQQASNYTPRTMRPPYGAINSNLVDFFAQQYGMSTIMWSIDTNDWRKPGVQKVINEAVTKARPGSIILIHDIHASSYQAVEGIVSGLIARGFKLVTVSQLMAMQSSSAAPVPAAAPAAAPVADIAAPSTAGVATVPAAPAEAPALAPALPASPESAPSEMLDPFGAAAPVAPVAPEAPVAALPAAPSAPEVSTDEPAALAPVAPAAPTPTF